MESIGRVGEVHDGGEILPHDDALHAPRHPLHGSDSLLHGLERNPLRNANGDGCQDVVDVEIAGEHCLYWELPIRSYSGEGSSGGGVGDPPSCNVGWSLQAVGEMVAGRDLTQVLERGVIGVEDGDLRRAGLAERAGEVAEEAGFGLPVALVGFVVVQVFVGDVGHHRHVEIAGRDPVLGQAMRSGFQDDAFRACVHHLGQITLHLERIGGGDMKASFIVLVADEGLHRADHPCLVTRSDQDAADELDGSGLAVGARNADDAQLAGRVAVKGSGEIGQGLTGVGDENPRN